MSRKVLDDRLEIVPGDSVIVIGEDGKIKKLIMPEMRENIPHTEGTEKVLEILQLFDPKASIETFENIDKGKLH